MVEILNYKHIPKNGKWCPFCGQNMIEDNFCFNCAREVQKPLADSNFISDLKDIRCVWRETQAEVAKNAGMPVNAITRLESGKNHHSTKTIQRVINALFESKEYTLRVAPKKIPLWAMLHDEGEYLFELMAWKLDYIADKCQAAQRVVDWQTIVKETRRAAMVCRRLRTWDDFNPPKIGMFRGEKNWVKYQDYMYYQHLEYLFKLLRKARCWWW